MVAIVSIFQDPNDENRLCQVLKAYVEEWGPQNVIVLLPASWRRHAPHDLGKVRLKFIERQAISIQVSITSDGPKYEVQLKPRADH